MASMEDQKLLVKTGRQITAKDAKEKILAEFFKMLPPDFLSTVSTFVLDVYTLFVTDDFSIPWNAPCFNHETPHGRGGSHASTIRCLRENQWCSLFIIYAQR